MTTKAAFGWFNTLLSAALSASSQQSGLQVSNLATDQGAAASGWQTVSGITSAWFQADSGSPATTWQAFLLARTNLTTAATVRWRIGAPEAFTEVAPAVNVDFTAASPVLPTGWNFARASTATYFDATGTLQSAANDTPRYDYDPLTLAVKGLLLEESRANGIRNSTMVGAAAGTPGTLPTNWAVNSFAGLTQQIVGTGTVNGITYIDIKWSGTSSSTFGIIYHETTTGTAASNAQVWTSSAYLAIVAGSQTNMGVVQFDPQEYTSGGSFIQNDPGPAITLTSTLTRFSYTRTLNGGATVGAYRYGLAFNWSSGVALNFTLRIGLPQNEIGPQASSVIPTSTVAVTRATETCYIAQSPIAPRFTLMASMTDFAIGNTAATIIGAGYSGAAATVDGTSLKQNNTTTLLTAFNNGSSNYATVANVNYAGGQGRVFIAADTSTAAACGSDGVVQTGAVSLSGMPAHNDRIYIGCPAGNAAPTVGGLLHFRKVAFWATRLSNNQISSYATTGSTVNTATVTYDSGVVTAGIVPGYGQSLTVAPTPAVGQVCRCDIADGSNPDTFLNVALAYAGAIWQPTINPSWSSATGRDGQVDIVLSRGGQQFPMQRWQRRRWSLKFEGIRAVEAWPKIMELDRVSRAGGNVLFVPDYTTNAGYETVFGICTPKADLGFASTSFDTRGWAADFTERL